MDVVVVESPAKAKTINKYLGSRFKVLASYGHVRDLPPKDGSVRPDADFAMDWEVDAKAKKHIAEITAAVRGADHLYLATDPDREGEAISWHVCKVLEEKKALNGVDVKRVVFNAITKNAILDAFEQPRELDEELVQAYLARRALDYLVGFTLSPVLWRKLPGSRSAGRVQSVALRLICERESEIEDFVSEEYWTVSGLFGTAAGKDVVANLTHLEGRKLKKMDIGDRSAAEAAVRAVETREFSVGKVERKKTRRNPAPPFITSTLQQEASRKLGFSATHTMRVAQRLYEGVTIGGETIGLITYMRTDGVQMAGEAIDACRELIATQYGKSYLPEKARIYKTKAKNAQEAHEAIRPTDVNRRPDDVARSLDADQLKLYRLIWQRTLASQMESAVLDQVAVDLVSQDRQVTLRATGSVIAFDGFLKLYREGRDDPDRSDDAGGSDESEGRILPPLAEGESVKRLRVDSEQHFTQPPPRFTEASLVKRMEELGIGRPSTYASILGVLQDRNYVRLESRRFFPEDRGRLVTTFLTSFFERYVAYSFTAEMEGKLDDVSGGRVEWKTVLDDFWRDFSAAVGETKDLRVKEVLDALDERLGPHFFKENADGSDPRVCPACTEGRLGLKLGRYGAFIGCANYPECKYTRPLIPNTDEDPAASLANGNQELGSDPETGLQVTLRKGPYGHYVQLGEPEGEGKKKTKPRRASLVKGTDPATVDLNKALSLLSLPREVGPHPETGEVISAGLGRYGPYLKMGSTYVSLKEGDDVLDVGLNRAVVLFAEAPQKKSSGKSLGDHPSDGKPVTLRAGRYGPYVQHGSLRASLPSGVDAETLDLNGAVTILEEKSAKSPAKKPAAKKAPAKKPAAKKAAPKKSPAKKTIAKKPAAKKTPAAG